MNDSKRHIAALLARREKLSALGDEHGVADVDVRLRVLGHTPLEVAAIEPQVETAIRKKPQRRKRD